MLELDGPLFIDRCPKLFASVLEQLRTNVEVCTESEVEARKLRQEFRFYGLNPGDVVLLTAEQTIIHEEHSNWRERKDSVADIDEYLQKGWEVKFFSCSPCGEDGHGGDGFSTFILERK